MTPALARIRQVAVNAIEWGSGVRTAGRVNLEDLGLAHADRVYYIASRRDTLRRVLDRREVGVDDVFVDLGSGMGRMVFQAARSYPFKRVIGVELSEDLHRIAQANAARNRRRLRCTNIELVCSDVLDWEIPVDVTVVYLFNPFGGTIFSTVVDRLIESFDRRPRTLRVIYLNPELHESLLATGRFSLARRVASRGGIIAVYRCQPAAS